MHRRLLFWDEDEVRKKKTLILVLALLLIPLLLGLYAATGSEKRGLNVAMTPTTPPSSGIVVTAVSPLPTSTAKPSATATAEAIKKYVPLHTGMVAMDFGCGTGLVTLHIQPFVQRISALDMSSGMLSVLREKLDKTGIENVEPVWAEREDQPFPEPAYDLIVSSMTLHHVRDYKGMLKKMYRYLAPGGYIAIADLEKERGDFHNDNSTVAHFGFDPDKIRRIAEKIGFNDVQTPRIQSIRKEVDNGRSKEFPVFLLVGRKEQ